MKNQNKELSIGAVCSLLKIDYVVLQNWLKSPANKDYFAQYPQRYEVYRTPIYSQEELRMLKAMLYPNRKDETQNKTETAQGMEL